MPKKIEHKSEIDDWFSGVTTILTSLTGSKMQSSRTKKFYQNDRLWPKTVFFWQKNNVFLQKNHVFSKKNHVFSKKKPKTLFKKTLGNSSCKECDPSYLNPP